MWIGRRFGALPGGSAELSGNLALQVPRGSPVTSSRARPAATLPAPSPVELRPPGPAWLFPADGLVVLGRPQRGGAGGWRRGAGWRSG